MAISVMGPHVITRRFSSLLDVTVICPNTARTGLVSPPGLSVKDFLWLRCDMSQFGTRSLADKWRTVADIPADAQKNLTSFPARYGYTTRTHCAIMVSYTSHPEYQIKTDHFKVINNHKGFTFSHCHL